MIDPDLMQKIIEKAQESFVEGIDRRLEDGTIVCGVCDKPKTVCPKEGVFKGLHLPIHCDCQKAKYEQEQKEKETTQRKWRIKRIKERAFELPAYMEKRFDVDLDPESKTSKTCRRYCDRWEKVRESGSGLLLYGSVGTGKSFYACCIANELIERYQEEVYVTTIPKLITDLQQSENREAVMWKIRAMPLLVLDDLGAQRETSFANEQLFAIIDTRLLARKPTIITTNLMIEDIYKPRTLEENRIFDRILEMCPIQLRCDGRSRRQEAMKKKVSQAISDLT